VDPAAALSFIHHQPAAVPSDERPYRERQAHAADGEPFRDPLPDPEPHGPLEDGGVAVGDAPLGGEGVDGLDGSQGLRDDAVRRGVLGGGFSREEDEVLAVDETGDDEEEERREGDDGQPPREVGGEGEAGDEHRAVHQECWYLQKKVPFH
ncbi:unnamed protein product, partial [Linum tenue]